VLRVNVLVTVLEVLDLNQTINNIHLSIKKTNMCIDGPIKLNSKEIVLPMNSFLFLFLVYYL